MTEGEYTFKIDSEFRRLSFSYSKEEYAVLEQEIIQDGCRQPVVVWYGHIVQGFERYEICVARNIAFETKNISFCVREEVISSVCRKELSNRYLPENQRRYLIGKKYNADMVIEAHNAAGTDRFRERTKRVLSKGKEFYENEAGQTKERIADEYHLNRCSVTRYSMYAHAIDYIAFIQPETVSQILGGEIKTTMKAVMACYGKTEDEVIKLLTASRRSLSDKKSVFLNTEIVKETTIKDMPPFDPDAEINSLSLTIPSWISSIDRTRSTAKLSLSTSEGRNRLEQKLYQLQNATQIMLHALKEARQLWK